MRDSVRIALEFLRVRHRTKPRRSVIEKVRHFRREVPTARAARPAVSRNGTIPASYFPRFALENIKKYKTNHANAHNVKTYSHINIEVVLL